MDCRYLRESPVVIQSSQEVAMRRDPFDDPAMAAVTRVCLKSGKKELIWAVYLRRGGMDEL